MLAKTVSCGLDGVTGYLVDVEAFIGTGMISFDVVGLPSAAIKESRDRIRAAIAVSKLPFPMGKVVVNLSPANVKKEGTSFELAIAVAMLAAKTPDDYQGLSDVMLLGELSLEGKLMPVRGALSTAITAVSKGIKQMIVPTQNAKECECINDLKVYPANSLLEVLNHLSGKYPLQAQKQTSYQMVRQTSAHTRDMALVKGQPMARKAIEIAAAGGHNFLMMGIPGSGKTMLARCLPSILPPLTYEESLETTMIHSTAGELVENSGLMTERPFRSPHHNISMPAMIGGGMKARPGEVSLAHHGVLFLDELPEFQRGTLEALRQPLEDGYVTITRMSGQNRYQSHCMLVVGMNPCPCGYHGSNVKACTCSAHEIKRYLSKVSGPLLDRIDLQVQMDAVTIEQIESQTKQESSAEILARVMEARRIQQKRYENLPIFCNAQLDQRGIERYCLVKPEAKEMLMRAIQRFGISMRTYGRIRKVARTIADLAGHEMIELMDVALAIQLRRVDGIMEGKG